LLLALGWWFTRDVTYVGNVKVSGLDATDERYREPLRLLAEDFAVLVNELAARGYAWQSGGLPALRAADALSENEAARYVALGSLEVKGAELAGGGLTAVMGERLRDRGWETSQKGETAAVSYNKSISGIEGRIRVEILPGGRERLLMEVATRPL
jgi:hypothetical protein